MIESLQNIVGEDSLLLDNALEERYEHIWRMDVPLQAKAVLLPRTTEQIAQIMKVCSAHNQPVVVHGGLTNLVQSTKSTIDDVVISMEKMNRIEEVDVESRTMTVQAGVILEKIHIAANEQQMTFPLTYGAKGSAQIGGAISTNAGGLRVLKYGMTRDLVLGLEVVLADGTILSSMKKVIKNNVGYDLKQLFIGAEGTLGIVTKAVLKLVESPLSRCAAFVGLENYKQVIGLLKKANQLLGDQLSAFEILWGRYYRGMTVDHDKFKPPIAPDYPIYVLLEMVGTDAEKDYDSLVTFLENSIQTGLILDGAVANTSDDLNWFFGIREEVSIVMNDLAYSQLFDVSIPPNVIGAYVDQVRNELLVKPEITEVYAFGHVADGNIHFVVGKSQNDLELTKAIDEVVYRSVRSFNGSVSAEHGIGLDKRAYTHFSKTTQELDMMRRIKQLFDPQGLLNRGKIFEL